ncbi:MAG: serine/threonine-protein kinase [Candidatus Xenobia bacterium]
MGLGSAARRKAMTSRPPIPRAPSTSTAGTIQVPMKSFTLPIDSGSSRGGLLTCAQGFESSERNTPPMMAGAYRITAPIAEGGMGVVFRGEHCDTGERVAIKVLKVADEEFIERFRREVGISTSIVHPNVCRVLAHGDMPEGPPYLVMELLEGETLSAFMERHGPLSMQVAIAIMEQVLSGLSVIHEHGIVHRDLKPANIFMVADGTVRILDFGIARSIKAASITRTGQRMGTSYYVAPEQVGQAKRVDARADLFSCGLIMFEMLTGALPYGNCDVKDVLRKLFANDLLDAQALRPDLPASLVAWIRCAMAVQIKDRFPSAQAARQALDAIV